MIQNIFQATNENILIASKIIKDGGLVAMPTETVYGLAASIKNKDAIKNIFKVKERPLDKPLIVHISDISDVKKYAKYDDRVTILAEKFWPGPLTIILNALDNVKNLDVISSNTQTISFRMPNHPVAIELIKKVGTPLVAPSANMSGHPSPTSAQEVQKDLRDRINFILDGGKCEIGTASTVLNLTQKQGKILRLGTISKEDLEKTLDEKIL